MNIIKKFLIIASNTLSVKFLETKNAQDELIYDVIIKEEIEISVY